MTADQLLDLKGVAEYLGITHGSAQTYHGRAKANRKNGTPKPSDLPEPDWVVGKSPVWWRSTIQRMRDGQRPRTPAQEDLAEVAGELDRLVERIDRRLGSDDPSDQQVGQLVLNAVKPVVSQILAAVEGPLAGG